MYTVLTIAALFTILLFLRRRKRNILPLPPGPKGKFLIGNALDMPKAHEWETYAKWAQIYDRDILGLNVAGKNLIILNSVAAAEELFDRRSATYSSRPTMVMLCELMGWDFLLTLLKYGPTWRRYRKFVHQSINNVAVNKFKPHILKSVHTMAHKLLTTPEAYKEHVHHMASGTILLMTYGIQIKSQNDPMVEINEKALATLNEAVIPGRFLVDALPFLKYVPAWFPGADFKRKAKLWRTYSTDLFEIPFQTVRNDILAGKGVNSLVADGLRAIHEDEDFADQEDIVKKAAGAMYTAGGETTVASITNGILALTLYPEVLKKAQAEIDRVVKPGNLPDFNDREFLPYLTALVKEIWRWSPIAAVGVAHLADEDDVYKGYRIPAGSIVVPNQWGMMHDEALYPDPFTFNPDRFMKDGKINPEVQDPEGITFGFGRRICPGRHFASLAVWMAMTTLIALFDISKDVDEDGNVIEPAQAWPAYGMSPLPFRCRIVPRSDKAVAAIQRSEGYEYFTGNE